MKDSNDRIMKNKGNSRPLYNSSNQVPAVDKLEVVIQTTKVNNETSKFSKVENKIDTKQRQHMEQMTYNPQMQHVSKTLDSKTIVAPIGAMENVVRGARAEIH